MKRNRIRRRLRTFAKRLPGVALELLNPFELLIEMFCGPDSGLALVALVGALAVVLLVPAIFFRVIFDSFDRTPLQTLSLK